MTRMMHPARQCARNTVIERSEYGGDDATVRCGHRAPHARIPREPLALRKLARLTRPHGFDVHAVVHRGDLVEVERARCDNIDATDRIAHQRIRNPLRLPRRIERLGRRYIVIRIEDLDGIASLSVPPRIIPVTPETTFKEEVQKHCN